MNDARETWFERPRNVRRVIRALYVVCAATFAADFLIHRHVDHPWEALTGFYAVYGLAACVALVLVARQLRKVVMRREDHYDD